MASVLLVVASKHGATADIADRIAERLRSNDVSVVTAQPEGQIDLDEFDAAVIGSAVYTGRWLSAAREFVAEHSQSLRDMPVWLFSSGPVGSDQSPTIHDREVDRLVEDTSARDHHVFTGRLEHDHLSLVERLMVKATGAPYGDFRNWSDIDIWADAVATDVKRQVASA